jgi:tetratricopeptide (TPR) repeat protein
MLRYDRAAQRYEEYLRLDERAPRILYKLALARHADGQPTAAIAVLRRAIALESKFAEAHYLLGLCLRDVRDLRGAVTSLERAVAVGPAMLQAREELAELYAQQGRQRDRIKLLDELLALDPGPSREVALGLAYAEAGRLENAVLKLGDATERYPDHAYTYVALGRVWLQTAQRDRASASRRVSLTKALAALEGAVNSDDSSEAKTLLGRALLMAGADDERAERVLQEATEELPVDPSSFFYLAEAAERRRHFDVARRALMDFHAIDVERDGRRAAQLSERIADTSMRLNEPATAVRWYLRAVDEPDPDSSLLTKLADAQLRTGDSAGARGTIDRVLEKDPADTTARALLKRLTY